MPWRLIVIIVIFAVLLTFIGLNLSNTCDLSLGFKTYTGVPVYLTVFISFILGMVSSIPFFIIGSLKKMLKKDKKTNQQDLPHEPSLLNEQPKSKISFFRKKPKDNTDKGPYGID